MSELSNDHKFTLKTRDGKDFEVPEDGALGILALGYRGILMWREKREQVKATRKSEGQPKDDTKES